MTTNKILVARGEIRSVEKLRRLGGNQELVARGEVANNKILVSRGEVRVVEKLRRVRGDQVGPGGPGGKSQPHQGGGGNHDHWKGGAP